MGAGVDVGFGKNVRPTQEMVGTAIPGTAVSGVQTTHGPMQDWQNVPLKENGSGYHPSWERGYGIDKDGWAMNKEERIEANRYKAPDTYTSTDVKALQEEYDRQQQILAAQRQQFAELAAGSGTPQPRGAGSVNVGSRGPIQINPLNPVAQIKQPEILTGPFLGRWRR